MVDHSRIIGAPDPVPGTGVMCCYHCRFANRDTNLPLGTIASRQRFVECRHSPPSVVILPAGIDQVTGQVQMMIQSKFPMMGYTEFCHRFESGTVD